MTCCCAWTRSVRSTRATSAGSSTCSATEWAKAEHAGTGRRAAPHNFGCSSYHRARSAWPKKWLRTASRRRLGKRSGLSTTGGRRRRSRCIRGVARRGIGRDSRRGAAPSRSSAAMARRSATTSSCCCSGTVMTWRRSPRGAATPEPDFSQRTCPTARRARCATYAAGLP
jgi:hypothetical protein